MLNRDLEKILNYLYLKRGVDFNGYREAMIIRRTQKRLHASNTNDYGEYDEFLKQNPEELEHLFNVFTINVSSFYRNPLSFEVIRKEILTSIIEQKKETGEGIRVWSAGCAKGEEAYSIAMLLNELLIKEESNQLVYILGTDIDIKTIEQAKLAVYQEQSIDKLKYALVKKYFIENNGQFYLRTEIKDKVQFAHHNLLNDKQKVPPESIFGDFDIVLCRNVLIYFKETSQHLVFEKLFHAIRPNGYLVLGEAEIPPIEFKHKFRRIGRSCKIYKKISM